MRLMTVRGTFGQMDGCRGVSYVIFRERESMARRPDFGSPKPTNVLEIFAQAAEPFGHKLPARKPWKKCISMIILLGIYSLEKETWKFGNQFQPLLIVIL